MTLLATIFVLNLIRISANTAGNSTLESKQNPSILTEEPWDETDKNKRELPKIQSTLINILKPVPVVDTLQEEEKYGNTGDKFNRFGRGIVNGAETMANLLNSALNFPMEALKKLSRRTTETLNNLGGKLVGLQ